MIILCQTKGNCYIGKLFPCWENTFYSRSYLYSGVNLLDLQKIVPFIIQLTESSITYLVNSDNKYQKSYRFMKVFVAKHLLEACGCKNQISQGINVRTTFKNDRSSVAFYFCVFQSQFQERFTNWQPLPTKIRVFYGFVKTLFQVQVLCQRFVGGWGDVFRWIRNGFVKVGMRETFLRPPQTTNSFLSVPTFKENLFGVIKQKANNAKVCKINVVLLIDFSFLDVEHYRISSYGFFGNYPQSQVRVFLFITWYKTGTAWTHALEGPHSFFELGNCNQFK